MTEQEYQEKRKMFYDNHSAYCDKYVAKIVMPIHSVMELEQLALEHKTLQIVELVKNIEDAWKCEGALRELTKEDIPDVFIEILMAISKLK